MTLNANSISKIEATKNAFEKAFKENLVNNCFRTIVVNSIPLKDGEREKINDASFKEKFTSVLGSVSNDLINSFDHVGQFDTGNLMTSMVNSVTESVSLEGDYRQQRLINDIRLGRVNQDVVSLNVALENAFGNTKDFESKDIAKRFRQDIKYIWSVEDAKDVVDRIKQDVKDAIEETEAKNDLVEGTTQEIIDYKNEIAPPNDQYQDPNQPNDPTVTQDPSQNDPTATDTGDLQNTPDEDLISNPTDDGMSENGLDNEEEQIYASDDGTGSEPTSTGDATTDNTATDPNTDTGTEQPATDNATATPDAGTDPNANADANAAPDDTGDDTSGLDAGTDDGTGAEDPNASATDDPSGMTNDLGTPDGADTSDPNAAADDGSGDLGADDSTGADAGMDDGTGDLGTDTGAASEEQPAQKAGVVININGADLGKESRPALNLYNARSLAEKRIPIHPIAFSGMVLPDVNSLSAECVNAVGDVDKEFKIRFDGLKLASKLSTNIGKESLDMVNEKIDKYGKILGEAVSNSETFKRSLESLGITSQGLIRSNEDTLIVARNIINRFLLKKQLVSPTVRPYTSKENIFANAFDIVQLRQHLDRQKEPKTEEVNDLISRENVFYHNLVNFNDEAVKKEAASVVDLSKLNFRKAMSPNFITDYKIKVWEENIGDKSNIEINNEVVKRVQDKFEKLWMRKLNPAEMEIIKATTNQQDVTDIVPTPYEKFLITMSKESLLARGSESAELGARAFTKQEKKDIEWKARLMTTVYKSAEAFNILNGTDKVNFEKFTTMIKL